MSDAQDTNHWLGLWRAIGPVSFHKVLKDFPHLKGLFPVDKEVLQHYGYSQSFITALNQIDWARVENDLRWANQDNCTIITLADDHYPFLLKQISDAPPVLFVQGDTSLLNTPQLAIVGSRNPTPAGIECAQQFSAFLSQAGFTIVSGLALGIDAAAHQGALSLSQGKTIAVMATGPELVYPARHQVLATRIIEQGALVTEFPTGIGVRPEQFPRRNRIISGLSLGVIVVEAALKSGSLITARMAADQGREVFAIPGSIHNPLVKGCHALIKQGAKLIEKAEDILEELPGFTAHNIDHPLQPKVDNEIPSTYLNLLNCIEYAPTPIDIITTRSGLNVEAASSMLLMLELEGLITQIAGGYVRKANISDTIYGNQ